MPTERVYVPGVVAPTVPDGQPVPAEPSDATECSPPPAAAVYSAAKVMPSARTVSLQDPTRVLSGPVAPRVMLRSKPKQQLLSAELLKVYVWWLVVGAALIFFGYMVYEVVGDYLSENASTVPSTSPRTKPALPSPATRTPYPVYVAPEYIVTTGDAAKTKRRLPPAHRKHNIRSKKHSRR